MAKNFFLRILLLVNINFETIIFEDCTHFLELLTRLLCAFLEHLVLVLVLSYLKRETVVFFLTILNRMSFMNFCYYRLSENIYIFILFKGSTYFVSSKVLDYFVKCVSNAETFLFLLCFGIN